MKMKSFARFIGTILLVLSLLLVVSCSNKEKPAEITPEQGQEVIDIGTAIINSVDLKTLKVDATGALVLDANLKIEKKQGENIEEYFEIKNAHIDTSVVKYKVKKVQKDGTVLETTEPNIGVTKASATIKGNPKDPTKTAEFTVAVDLYPEDVNEVTVTKGKITINKGTDDELLIDVEETEPDDKFIMSLFSNMNLDVENIIVKEKDGDDYELSEDLLKEYGEGNVNATLKDVGLVFYGTSKEGTAYSAKLALDGSIKVETEAPKNGKRSATIDSNIDLTIKISYGDRNSEFTVEFQEKKSTNDLDGLIKYVEEALDNDLTMESAKALMAEIGLSITPRYASVNGVEVDAASYLNFLIAFAAEQANSKNEKEPEPQPQS